MTDQPTITLVPPPPLTQAEDREINEAMTHMRQLARDFLPHATWTFERQEFRWEDVAHEVLAVSAAGVSREERFALSEKLIDFIVDSESDVVRQRMTYTIR